MAYKYPMVLYFDNAVDGGIWYGNFPGLNGCWAEGKTREEVFASAPDYLHQYASACRELGWQLPEPPQVKELESAGLGEIFMITEGE